MLYDRFQKEAIDYINQGHSVIVCAPTGSGKTAIAEYIINEAFKKNDYIIYTAPIKALSNQKFRDFKEQFGANIGILTGDVSINPQAQVLIMTTEILRNKILDEPMSLARYSWVIFDEIHYIDNEERGTVWEETLIFLPKHLKVLALSATIPNIQELSHWIESIHKKPMQIIVENHRPVPLKILFQCQDKIISSLNELNCTGFSQKRMILKPNRLDHLITNLRQNMNLPCIYFVFSRRRAEDLAFELYRFDFLNAREKSEIVNLYNELCLRLDLVNEVSARRLFYLIQKGVAYHHAGMLPGLKGVVEELFTSRLLKVIFTTETFALGINMPARAVIFDGLRKFSGRYVSVLKTRDFYQMAGRAGRRGMDKVGFVFCRINPRRISFEEIKKIIRGKAEPVKSQFNLSYATILNLYKRYKESLFNLYPLTLHHHQYPQYQQKRALKLISAKLNLLKNLAYIKNNNLTNKGNFAAALYGYELILTQLYEQGVLEDLDEFRLGQLAVAVVFEPRKNQRACALPKNSRFLQHICEETFLAVKKKEISFGILPFSKKPYFHLAAALQAWLSGTDFSKIKRFTDTDEGEIIRYFRMGLQILKEINSSPATSDSLKERIKKVINILNRDVVDAQRQLQMS